MNSNLAYRFELPITHQLTADRHSPQRHGHNFYVTIKVPCSLENSLDVRIDLLASVQAIKSNFKNIKLAETAPHQTTEQITRYIVNQMQTLHPTLGLEEVHVQETQKNQFVWTNPNPQSS